MNPADFLPAPDLSRALVPTREKQQKILRHLQSKALVEAMYAKMYSKGGVGPFYDAQLFWPARLTIVPLLYNRMKIGLHIDRFDGSLSGGFDVIWEFSDPMAGLDAFYNWRTEDPAHWPEGCQENRSDTPQDLIDALKKPLQIWKIEAESCMIKLDSVHTQQQHKDRAEERIQSIMYWEQRLRVAIMQLELRFTHPPRDKADPSPFMQGATS